MHGAEGSRASGGAQERGAVGHMSAPPRLLSTDTRVAQWPDKRVHMLGAVGLTERRRRRGSCLTLFVVIMWNIRCRAALLCRI